MIKIMFVCHGNICRSPMAEAILKKMVYAENLDVQVESRGTSVYTEDPINPKSAEALATIGIKNVTHSSKQISKTDIEEADIVLTMTQQHKLSLVKTFPDFRYKIFTLAEYAVDSREDISDPFGKSQIFYNFCVQEIKKLVEALFEEIKEQLA